MKNRGGGTIREAATIQDNTIHFSVFLNCDMTLCRNLFKSRRFVLYPGAFLVYIYILCELICEEMSGHLYFACYNFVFE